MRPNNSIKTSGKAKQTIDCSMDDRRTQDKLIERLTTDGHSNGQSTEGQMVK